MTTEEVAALIGKSFSSKLSTLEFDFKGEKLKIKVGKKSQAYKMNEAYRWEKVTFREFAEKLAKKIYSLK